MMPILQTCSPDGADEPVYTEQGAGSCVSVFHGSLSRIMQCAGDLACMAKVILYEFDQMLWTKRKRKKTNLVILIVICPLKEISSRFLGAIGGCMPVDIPYQVLGHT